MKCVYCQGYGFTDFAECDRCRGTGEAHIESPPASDLLALAERRPMPHMHNDQACFDWMYEADAALREAHAEINHDVTFLLQVLRN
jgi:hypothetical protein